MNVNKKLQKSLQKLKKVFCRFFSVILKGGVEGLQVFL
jgi:hypothetical protein